MILMLYFSATGNSKFIAELFSRNMGAKCFSIEEDVNFTDEIKTHDTIAFCYPIYGSRVPRIMREFVARHMNELTGKRIIILVTQMLFSGDGARVFTDMFREGTIEVICSEHFNMPNNVCNVPILWKQSKRRIRRYISKAEAKMAKTCVNIKYGIAVKRGFSKLSKILGSIQGKMWQGDSKEDYFNQYKIGFQAEPSSKRAPKPKMEEKARTGLRIRKDCTVCGLCCQICPMKNLVNTGNEIKHKNNCTICYRCVNRCPHKAITVLFHMKPKWQYEGIQT